MNVRLQNEYDLIEKNNRERFLRNEIELDRMWETSIWGVTLQINLGELVKNTLGEYQKELAQIESDNLLLLPRSYQHISFNQVIFWGGEYAFGKEETWNRIADTFKESFTKLNSTYNNFSVTFSKLVATTGGIIWCGYDDHDEMEKLRKEFLEKLPFPEETTKFNHIIHTTVARYKNKLTNPKRVYEYVQSKTDEVSMQVKEIVLKKELMFPSIKTEDLASIHLI